MGCRVMGLWGQRIMWVTGLQVLPLSFDGSCSRVCGREGFEIFGGLGFGFEFRV